MPEPRFHRVSDVFVKIKKCIVDVYEYCFHHASCAFLHICRLYKDIILKAILPVRMCRLLLDHSVVRRVAFERVRLYLDTCEAYRRIICRKELSFRCRRDLYPVACRASLL